MSKLFIRHRPLKRWITFVNSVADFKELIFDYIPGHSLLIGDLNLFNKPMFNLLLKFIEEHPEIDCYSTVDVQNPVLLSRFTQVIKDKVEINGGMSIDEFKDSPRDYYDIESNFASFTSDVKLRLYHVNNSMLNLILNMNEQ